MKNLENLVKELTQRVAYLEQKIAILTGEKQSPVLETIKKERDKTKYMFRGSVYAKNQLVLAVVKTYVSEHPTTTYFELSKIFDKSLQGSLGVFQKYEVARQKSDAGKRFYMNNVITLPDANIVVCTQWGAFNINQFILRINELGYTVTEI